MDNSLTSESHFRFLSALEQALAIGDISRHAFIVGVHYMGVCNRTRWAKRFKVYTDATRQLLSSGKYITQARNELLEHGFLSYIDVSCNQHTATVVSLAVPVWYDKELDPICVPIMTSKGDKKQDKPKDKKEDKTPYKDLVDYWNKVNNCNLRPTEGKSKQIKARLATYSIDELKQSMLNRSKDEWINTEGLKYKTQWDSFWRNDEKIERYLTKISQKQPEPTRNILNL